MEFWGIEIKGDKPVKVEPGTSQVVHLSQATLADIKKVNEPVKLYAKVGEQKLVIGVLTADKMPHVQFDLVFEKEFELSHNLKNGSVHLAGYKSLMPDEDDEVFSDFSDEDEDLPLEGLQNGVPAIPAAAKAKLAALAAKKDDNSDESDDEDDGDSDDEDDSDSDEGTEVADEDDSDDSEDEKSEEEKETPVKSVAAKKRPASATKTPEAKKAKLVTPQKTDGKKEKAGGAHTDTPHPAKNSGKGDKSNAKTPKSGSQVTCGSCEKSFNSQKGLDSHSKAKHGK